MKKIDANQYRDEKKKVKIWQVATIALACTLIVGASAPQIFDIISVKQYVAANAMYNYTVGAGVYVGDTVTPVYINGGLVDGRDVATDGSKLDGIEAGATTDQIASEVPNTPAGTIAATDVQAALNELDSEKASLAGVNTFTDTTEATAVGTASQVLNGGLSVAKNIFIGKDGDAAKIVFEDYTTPLSATPACLNLANSYADDSTAAKSKMKFYEAGAGQIYGVNISASGWTFHTPATKGYIWKVNEATKMVLDSVGTLSTYGGLVSNVNQGDFDTTLNGDDINTTYVLDSGLETHTFTANGDFLVNTTDDIRLIAADDLFLEAVGDMTLNVTNGNLYLGGDAAYDVIFQPGGSTKMTLDNLGRLSVLAGYETLIDADTVLVNKKYVDDRVNPTYKSEMLTTQGIGSGTFFSFGFYESPVADANLTQASTTVTIGASNQACGGHAFSVFGGAGSVDAGVVGLRVTGTSINDSGTRTTSDSEILSADITGVVLNQYIETTKKWLGVATFELYIVSGAPTTYSLDFNYGKAKYEDFGNRDYTVTDFEAVGLAGNNDTSFNIELLEHSSVGWTYSAAAFIPGNSVIVNMSTDYSTDNDLVNTKQFAYKRALLSTVITGSGSEGVIVRVTTGSNNAIEYCNIHIGVSID